ncbi:MAG: hypothetical protein AAGA30_06275, partial [Planctomycetota bacterium]
MIFRRKQQACDREPEIQNDVPTQKIGYERLEPRRVLNASFGFDLLTTELTLSNFVDSDANDNFVEIDQSGDDFVFRLNDGVWLTEGPVPSLNFELQDGDRTLTIHDASQSISSIRFDGNTNDTFEIYINNLDFEDGNLFITNQLQTFSIVTEFEGSNSSLNVDQFVVSAGELHLENGSHDINSLTAITDNDARVADVDEINIEFMESKYGNISVVAGGDISIENTGFGLRALTGDVEISTSQQNADIEIANAVLADQGDIRINAADQVSIRHYSTIFAGETGQVEIRANLIGGDDGGAITMFDTSSIATQSGSIELTTLGPANEQADILISEIRTMSDANEAIIIRSGGNISDVTNSESPNLAAEWGGIGLVANGNIGGINAADLDILTRSLAFDTNQTLQVTNHRFGLTIDDLGSTQISKTGQGGSLQTRGELNIATNIEVGGNMNFVTQSSIQPDEDIRFLNDAVVRLQSNVPSNLAFLSADDIIFESGSVVAIGSIENSVMLLANQEQFEDGDLGAIVDLGSSQEPIVIAPRIVLEAGDGIGDSSNIDTPTGSALRINADKVLGKNTDSNGIRIIESDSILIENLTNLDRSIELFAYRNILDADQMTDSNDVAAAIVHLTSANGSIGTTPDNIFKHEFDTLKIAASSVLKLNAVNGSVSIAPVAMSPSTDITTNSLVIASQNDVDASSILDNGNLQITNLALIADADRDGVGDLFLNESIQVTGDLRLQGNTFVTTDTGGIPATASLTASRLLVTTNSAVEFDTSIDQLDFEFGYRSIASSNTFTIRNDRSLNLVDLDCRHFDDGLIQGAFSRGNVVLEADGDITQETSLFVVGDIDLFATGHICLAAFNPDGDFVANDFVGTVSAVGHSIEIVDANRLTVGEIAADKLVGLVSGIHIDSSMELSGDITVTDPAGQIYLESSDGVTQQGGALTANELILTGDGEFQLDSDNQISRLAADLQQSLTFQNSINLEIAELSFNACCLSSTQVSGVEIGDQLNFTVDGDLFQSAAVSARGVTRLTVTGDICLTGDRCNHGSINNDFNRIVITNARNAEIADINDVSLVTANVSENLKLAAGTRDTDIGDGNGGQLQLFGNLEVGDKVLLQASEGVVQSSGSIITETLMLGGPEAHQSSGPFDLQSANSVRFISAQLSGDLAFDNSVSLTVTQSQFTSFCNESTTIDGIAAPGSEIKLDVIGNLRIDRPIETNVFFAKVANDLTQSEAGTIESESVGLMVSGNTFLQKDNFIQVFAANNFG